MPSRAEQGFRIECGDRAGLYAWVDASIQRRADKTDYQLQKEFDRFLAALENGAGRETLPDERRWKHLVNDGTLACIFLGIGTTYNSDGGICRFSLQLDLDKPLDSFAGQKRICNQGKQIAQLMDRRGFRPAIAKLEEGMRGIEIGKYPITLGFDSEAAMEPFGKKTRGFDVSGLYEPTVSDYAQFDHELSNFLKFSVALTTSLYEALRVRVLNSKFIVSPDSEVK